VSGRLVATIVVVVAVVVVAAVAGRIAARRGGDEFASYYYRHLARYGAVFAGIVALIVVWRSAIEHLALFGGLLAAGLAFAMQEVIGSLAGWFNIVSGGIYRVGDRVEIAGVKGDVIDITLLRTKVLEMGSSLPEEPSWVGGRQSTGRIVTISNKATFESPTYSYSAALRHPRAPVADDQGRDESRDPRPFRRGGHRRRLVDDGRHDADAASARRSIVLTSSFAASPSSS
jgi:small-conductance mechanosensitive channel